MAILMPDLTVEVYNADYRVLSRIPWQEAVRLILRGAVYVIDVHNPAVHIHSPSLVHRATGVGGAARVRAHPVPGRDNRVTRDGVLRRDAVHLRLLRRAAPTPWTTFCRAPVAAGTPGSTWWRRARPATVSRATARRTKPG